VRRVLWSNGVTVGPRNGHGEQQQHHGRPQQFAYAGPGKEPTSQDSGNHVEIASTTLPAYRSNVMLSTVVHQTYRPRNTCAFACLSTFASNVWRRSRTLFKDVRDITVQWVFFAIFNVNDAGGRTPGLPRDSKLFESRPGKLVRNLEIPDAWKE